LSDKTQSVTRRLGRFKSNSIDISIKEKVDYIVNPLLDNTKGKSSKIVKFDEKGNLTVIRD